MIRGSIALLLIAITSIPAVAQDDLAREIAALKETVARLEKKIDTLTQVPSEFSRVFVRIVDEQGKPMKDFKVSLTSTDNGHRAKASGTSNEQGIALERHLPYGAYRLSATGHGWSMSSSMTVEVGQPLDLTLVAPTLDQFGELALESSLPKKALKGLPFGAWKSQNGNGWGTFVAPEPLDIQRSPGGWKTFPTVTDGIEEIGIVVEFGLDRRVKQTNGSYQIWQWQSTGADVQPLYTKWFVASDGTFQPFLSAVDNLQEIRDQDGPFGALVSDNNKEDSASRFEKKWLGYVDLLLGEAQKGEATIRLPAGQVNVFVDNKIYGRPSEKVLKVIDEPAKSMSEQIWLPATVKSNSQWLRILLGDSKSLARTPSGIFGARHYAKDIDLVAGARQSITIGAGSEDSL